MYADAQAGTSCPNCLWSDAVQQSIMGTHICLPLLSLLQRKRPAPVLTCESRPLTGCQLVSGVAQLSRCLTHQHGVQPGDVVMLAALNSDYFILALLAACDAGAIVTPVNQRWSAAELSSAMELTRPGLLLADEHCWGLVQHADHAASSGQHTAQPPMLQLEAFCAQAWQHLQSAQPESQASLTPQEASLQLRMPQSRAALICFTSGTTGQSIM